MNLLIVDDEVLLVEDILTSVNWAQLGISSTYSATTIRQAREILEQQSIDILLCDIELPQGNGLDLLEWAREHSPQTRPVVLTCHMDFRYAQRALQLGSLDFILKPIDSHELEATMREVIRKAESDSRKEEFSRYGEFWLKYQPIMVEKFWLDIISGAVHAHPDDIRRAAQAYNLSWDSEIRIQPVLFTIRRWAEKYNLYEQQAISFGVKNIVSEIMSEHHAQGHVLSLADDLFLLLLPGDLSGSSESDWVQVGSRQCADAVHKHLKADINAYIGQTCLLSGLAAQVQNLRDADSHNIAYENEVIVPDQAAALQLPLRTANLELWAMLLENDRYGEFLEQAEDYLSQPSVIGNLAPDGLKQLHYALLHLLFPIFERHGQSIPADNEIWQPDRTITDLREWLQGTVKALENAVEVEHLNQDVLERIRMFVDQNLESDCTRESIARQFFINPDYLDRLFKKNRGLSVTKYIEHRRIEFARELLEKTDLPINVIASRLGFRHTAHFSSVFKRIMQINPTVFRQQRN